jgi:hypothetical protein
MKPNVGNVDRIIRLLLGIGMLSLIALSDNNLRWLGLVGLIPLFTGIKGWCPLYAMLGVSTCTVAGEND